MPQLLILVRDTAEERAQANIDLGRARDRPTCASTFAQFPLAFVTPGVCLLKSSHGSSDTTHPSTWRRSGSKGVPADKMEEGQKQTHEEDDRAEKVPEKPRTDGEAIKALTCFVQLRATIETSTV